MTTQTLTPNMPKMDVLQVLELVYKQVLKPQTAEKLMRTWRLLAEPNEEKYLEAILASIEGARGDINSRVNTRLYIVLGIFAVITASVPFLLLASQVVGLIGSVALFATTIASVFLWSTEHAKIKQIQKWLIRAEKVFEELKPEWVGEKFELYEHYSDNKLECPSTHTKRNHLFMLSCALMSSFCLVIYMAVNFPW